MTISETVAYFADYARSKTDLLSQRPLAFFVSSMMAGAYVGAGILLIFSVGQPLDPSMRALAMGASFGIALTLVVFAGSELFTGYAMYMTLGRLRGTTSSHDLARTWAASWTGNLAGSALLGALFVWGGGGSVLKESTSLLFSVADYKIASDPVALLCRGALCNWLVCLALWTSARTKDDVAKCVLIFWCLFAFIACGFEHSVANMTIFSTALIAAKDPAITVGGAMHNLFWVTIGNIIGGAVFVALGYWAVAGRLMEKRPAAVRSD
jgi:nitrite transporter